MPDLVTFFNSYPKCLSTVDVNGIPNVCLTGAALMTNQDTIVLAGGFIQRTLDNIKANGKATFMPWSPMIIQRSYWEHYDKTGEKHSPAGYRFYCTLNPDESNGSHLSKIMERIEKTIGKRIRDGLKYALVFRIDDIREVDF